MEIRGARNIYFVWTLHIAAFPLHLSPPSPTPGVSILSRVASVCGVLLPSPLEWWGYRCAPCHLVYVSLGSNPQSGACQAGLRSTSLWVSWSGARPQMVCGSRIAVLFRGVLKESPAVVRTTRCDPRLRPRDMCVSSHLALLLGRLAAGVIGRKDGRDLPKSQQLQRRVSWRSIPDCGGLVSCALC